MTWALLVAILSGGLGCALFWAALQAQKRVSEQYQATMSSQHLQILALEAALREEQGSRRDDARRLEAVIKSLKAEVEILEQDTIACAQPDAVRERLRRLLSSVP